MIKILMQNFWVFLHSSQDPRIRATFCRKDKNDRTDSDAHTQTSGTYHLTQILKGLFYQVRASESTMRRMCTSAGTHTHTNTIQMVSIILRKGTYDDPAENESEGIDVLDTQSSW